MGYSGYDWLLGYSGYVYGNIYSGCESDINEIYMNGY